MDDPKDYLMQLDPTGLYPVIVYYWPPTARALDKEDDVIYWGEMGGFDTTLRRNAVVMPLHAAEQIKKKMGEGEGQHVYIETLQLRPGHHWFKEGDASVYGKPLGKVHFEMESKGTLVAGALLEDDDDAVKDFLMNSHASDWAGALQELERQGWQLMHTGDSSQAGSRTAMSQKIEEGLDDFGSRHDYTLQFFLDQAGSLMEAYYTVLDPDWTARYDHEDEDNVGARHWNSDSWEQDPGETGQEFIQRCLDDLTIQPQYSGAWEIGYP